MDKEFWIIIGIFVLAFGLWTVRWYLTRDKGTMTGIATVISKTPEVGHGGKWADNWSYRVRFEVGSVVLDLYVLRQEYEAIETGMTGLLTWQDQNMLEFIPDQQEV